MTGALLVVLFAMGALGADAPLPSFLGGAALCGLGLAAALRRAPPLPFWFGTATITVLALVSASQGRLALAAPELAVLSGCAGAFACGALGGSETRAARRAASLVLWTLLGVLVLAFVAHAADPDSVMGRPKPYHQGRLTGPFLSANTMATLCVVGLALALPAVARAGRGAATGGPSGALRWLESVGRKGLGAGLVVLFGTACLLLTGSRAGIAAGLLVVGATMLWGRRGLSRSGLLIAGALLATVFAASGSVLGDRLAGVGADGNGRQILWAACLAAIAEAPWLGAGLGAFPRAIAPHAAPETAGVLAAQGAAHNVALHWLVQTGVLGTALGALTLASLARTLIGGLRRRRRGRWLLRGALLAFGAALLHGQVDYALEVPALAWLLSLVVGLGAGVATGETALADRRARPRG